MTLVGWCPGGRPVPEMLGMYPGTGAARIFVGAGKPIPDWSGPVLGPLGTEVVPHVSFKTWDLAPVVRLVDGIPDGQLLILTYAHEPEQGQAAGDPTPEQFHARWAELVARLAGHPKRDRVLLAPVYTRYWWQANVGDRRWLVRADVDVHGWDVYNNGSAYRSPDDLLTIPRQVAKDTGLPYLVAELGAVDVGPGRAEWMRAMVDAAAADGALTVSWFHRDEWDLTASADAQQTWQTLILREAPVTTSPRNLLDVRQLLLAELGPHGLASAEVGIVGNAAHRGGYHCGEDRTVRNDYSVVESRRDSTGLTDHASGLDVGTFSYRDPGGRTHNLPSFSRWCVGQCEAGAEGTADIREIIYSPDGRTVKRWDRLGKRASGDDSHLFHTHFSFFRDSTKAGRDLTPLFRRYLTTIGLMEDPDMLDADDLRKVRTQVALGIYDILHVAGTGQDYLGLTYSGQGASVRQNLRALTAAPVLAALGERDDVDEQAIVTGVLAGLSPEAIAAAIPAELAKQVADELAARLVS
ncbi:MAG TPA: hypothetical protein VIQ30_00475 [Pseudonocardia sp.]